MISSEDPVPVKEFNPAEHPIRNAIFRSLAGVIGATFSALPWWKSTSVLESLATALVTSPLTLMFLCFAIGGYAGFSWWGPKFAGVSRMIYGSKLDRQIPELRSDEDYRLLRASPDLLFEIDDYGDFKNLRSEIRFIGQFNWGSYRRALGPFGLDRELSYPTIDSEGQKTVSFQVEEGLLRLLVQLDSVGVCFYGGIGSLGRDPFHLVYVREGYLVSQAIQEISRVHAAMQADLRESRPLGVVSSQFTTSDRSRAPSTTSLVRVKS